MRVDFLGVTGISSSLSCSDDSAGDTSFRFVRGFSCFVCRTLSFFDDLFSVFEFFPLIAVISSSLSDPDRVPVRADTRWVAREFLCFRDVLSLSLSVSFVSFLCRRLSFRWTTRASPGLSESDEPCGVGSRPRLRFLELGSTSSSSSDTTTILGCLRTFLGGGFTCILSLPSLDSEELPEEIITSLSELPNMPRLFWVAGVPSAMPRSVSCPSLCRFAGRLGDGPSSLSSLLTVNVGFGLGEAFDAGEKLSVVWRLRASDRFGGILMVLEVLFKRCVACARRAEIAQVWLYSRQRQAQGVYEGRRKIVKGIIQVSGLHKR